MFFLVKNHFGLEICIKREKYLSKKAPKITKNLRSSRSYLGNNDICVILHFRFFSFEICFLGGPWVPQGSPFMNLGGPWRFLKIRRKARRTPRAPLGEPPPCQMYVLHKPKARFLILDFQNFCRPGSALESEREAKGSQRKPKESKKEPKETKR